MLNYWLEYYNDNFINYIERIKNLHISDYNKDFICDEYAKLIEVSCNLLKYYLSSKGLFQFISRDIIKEAFYVELIDDGDEWINALSLAEVYSKFGALPCYNLILQYISGNKFYIFTDLEKKFKQLAEEHND